MIQRMNSLTLMRKLLADGWTLARINSSHHMFTKPGNQHTITLPHPRKDVAIGTLKDIEKKAGWK